MIRRPLTLLLLACWLPAVTGLALVWHVEHEGKGHNSEGCAVCHILLSWPAATVDQALPTIDVPASTEKTALVTVAVLATDNSRSSISSRAPPAA